MDQAMKKTKGAEKSKDTIEKKICYIHVWQSILCSNMSKGQFTNHANNLRGSGFDNCQIICCP